MSVYVETTFVSQLSFAGDANLSSYGPAGRRDPTGCWYAGACMVAFFFEAGPRLGVPSQYSPTLYGHGGHRALAVSTVATLAANEHLEPVPGAGGALDSATLEELLRSSGPIWFAWRKTNNSGQTYGHVAVLIGVDNSYVTFHDPEDAPNSSIAIDRFNALRYCQALGDSSMLRRAGNRATIIGQVLPKIRAKL